MASCDVASDVWPTLAMGSPPADGGDGILPLSRTASDGNMLCAASTLTRSSSDNLSGALAGRCRLTVSTSVLKARLVSALETKM